MHHLDIHTEIDGTKGGERHDGGVGNQGYPCLVGDIRQLADVSHEQLRIGDNLEEQRTGLVIDLCPHLFRFREIDKTRFYAEVAQRIANQRDTIAKQMLRGHDVEASRTDSRVAHGLGRLKLKRRRIIDGH